MTFASLAFESTSIGTSGNSGFSAGFSLPDLASHRQAMLRFAKRKVRDEELAEDAVQDALMAAVVGASSFQGQSAPRTWLMGILNHKIQDVFRRETRYVRIEDVSTGGYEAEGDSFDDASAFDRLERDDFVIDPMKSLTDKRMGQILIKEVDALPEGLREVVRLHLIEGKSTAEVCQELNISEANCWVRIHRARKRLEGALKDH